MPLFPLGTDRQSIPDKDNYATFLSQEKQERPGCSKEVVSASSGNDMVENDVKTSQSEDNSAVSQLTTINPEVPVSKVTDDNERGLRIMRNTAAKWPSLSARAANMVSQPALVQCFFFTFSKDIYLNPGPMFTNILKLNLQLRFKNACLKFH